MKRIMIIATLAALAQTVAAFSPLLQTFPEATSLRRIQVNARTISALPADRNYVADLTQRGTVYEFNSQSGQIDFSRVKVRTTQGEVAIGSFMETTFPKGELDGFKLGSQAFSIGTRPPGNPQNPPTASEFKCNERACRCRGKTDCFDLILNTSLCGGVIYCYEDHIGYTCACSR